MPSIVLFGQSMLDLPRWVLELGFVVYAILISGFVVLERRRPTATLALLLALVFVPVLGLLCYLVLSQTLVLRRRVQRRNRLIDAIEGTRRVARVAEPPAELSPVQRGLVRLAMAGGAAPLRRANEVTLLDSPELALASVEEAIARAERSIHCEFYIWRDDATGRRMTERLTQRAREGVKVRVLYDHLGSLSLPSRHFANLIAAGGQAAPFGRIRLGFGFIRPRSRLNFRNHRKLIAIDASVGFVGGLNVADEYLSRTAGRESWRDLLVRFDGDAAIGVEATFLDDWLVATGEVVALDGRRPLRAIGIDGRKRPRRHRWQRGLPDARTLREANPFRSTPERPVVSTGPLVQVIPSGPDLPLGSILEAQVTAAISLTLERAFIATPYFVPDESLTLALRAAAMRGVDVRILVPTTRQSDIKVAAYAGRSYYDALLDAGCRVYEYEAAMLHSKYLILDEFAAIGSANMDVRSFHLNYEITAMFYDAQVAQRLAAVFTEDLGRAREVTPHDRATLSIFSHLAEGGARLLSPLL